MPQKKSNVEYRLNAILSKWLEWKSTKIKEKYVKQYRSIVLKGLHAILEAIKNGETRKDGTPLHWRPEQITEDELNIVLDRYNYTKRFVLIFSDFLQYYDNNLLKRYAWTPRKTRKRNKHWRSLEELDLIRTVAADKDPETNLVVELLYLTIRPVGILQLRMDGIVEMGVLSHFVVRDKGRDRDDKELGKLHQKIWDPDTKYIVRRYLEYRESLYQRWEEIVGHPVPRAERLMVWSFGKKVQPYKNNDSQAIWRIIKRLGKDPRLKKLGPITPYQIRRAAESELEFMTQMDNPDRLRFDDLVERMGWENGYLVRGHYRTPDAALYAQYQIMKRKNRLREELREELGAF